MTTPPLTSPVSTGFLRDPQQLAAHLRSQRASTGAEEFEASLFSSVLEKMEKNLSLSDDQDSDAGKDTWCALGVQAVSQALAHRHVLGVASMIEHALGLPSNSVPASGTPPTQSQPQEK